MGNITDILQYVNDSMCKESFVSSDLYGAYMQAVDILDAEIDKTLTDTMADYTSHVVFTDGTDRAQRHNLSVVRAKVGMSDIDTFWAVPVSGESEADY